MPRVAKFGAVSLLVGAVAAAVTSGVACGGGGGGGSSSGGAALQDGGGDGSLAPQSLCPNGQAVEWPPGPYAVTLGSTLPPDLVFAGVDGPVALRDAFEPCAAQSRLLIVRTSAAWCGTCVWNVAHTKRILDDPRFAGRLVLLDLLVADEENMPATPEAAKRWLSRIDAPGKLAIDVKYTFAPALISRSPLPEYVFIDTRTMTVRSATGATAPEVIQNKVVLELASLDHLPYPALTVPQLFDGFLSEDQQDMLRDMKLSAAAAPPPDPTNEYGDDPGAIALGKDLFSDAQLSPSGTVSCATCHDQAKTFTDAVAQSTGVAKVDRNAPSVVRAAFARWQFWDGRADTLWAQALGPPENPKEVGSSRLFIAHGVFDHYKDAYTAVFGAKYPLPDLSDTVRFPPSGKPGDGASFDAMPQADRDAVTRVYVNVGKAIAAFERSLRLKPNALDAYAGGDVTALTAPQKKALQSYFNAGCAQCHYGPSLADDAFHVLRFPTGRQDGLPDRGRIDVLDKLAAGEFTAASKWSDAPGSAKPLVFAQEPSMLGAFRTPSLRGLPTTAPYGHGGMFKTPLEVVQHYGTRAKNVGDDRAVGVVEPWVPEFDTNAQAEIAKLFDVMGAELGP